MKVQVPAHVAMADVLEEAAGYIQAGWTQGRPFEDVEGQLYVCTNGALWLAAGLIREEGTFTNFNFSALELWTKTRHALSDHVGQDSVGWNDSIGQTRDHVADTMLQLAKELRGAETP